jgi:hypothetical protein
MRKYLRKHLRDPNQWAKAVVDLATGQTESESLRRKPVKLAAAKLSGTAKRRPRARRISR